MFYYGTRLIITPFFQVGNNDAEWAEAYHFFRDTVDTLNARAVLKGKSLRSYIALTPKRKKTNHYIRRRGRFSVKDCVERYGDKDGTRIVYPHVVSRNKKDINSLPSMVNKKSSELTESLINDVEIIDFYGQESYCIKKRDFIISCFEKYTIDDILNSRKSHLALNGNSYLWRVQQIQVELLVEFDRICRKYNLKYNISFGTLLGAIRHKGFIPWDDDIDVTLPVDDYNRLDDIMKTELDTNKYYFRCPENEEKNHLIFKHLERKGTIYTKPGREKLNQEIGVFIDIFPMYPSAHTRLSDWIHAKICRYWRTALWATIGADSEPNEKKKRYYKKISKPGNKICYQKFVKAATFFKNSRDLKFWIAMDRNPYKTPLVKMTNYTDAIEVEFEGHKFMAAKNYKQVLNYCFGEDWSMYPSTSERVTLHNAIMQIGELYKAESEGAK